MNHYQILDIDIGCTGLHKYFDKQAKCSYVKFHKGCQPKGYISYLQLFYCTFDPKLGHIVLILWLILLFYLLGDTAANYFCSSLEGLSRILKLSPTIAGVTLLSLGNGAPDLFSSLVSFMGDGTKDVGLNSILGVSLSQMCRNKDKGGNSTDGSSILPVTRSVLGEEPERLSELGVPLLGCIVDEQKGNSRCFNLKSSTSCFFGRLLYILELPLCLPRRLTIPVISAERWSKPFAVVSVTVAPVLLAFMWNSHGSKPDLLIYAIGGLIGVVSGVLAIFTTERSNPPRKWLLPWLAEGFLMSITWTYILAQELVSLLVSLGLIFGISPSILGLTVLAWGNSLGDLVANVTMARSGGPDGAKVSISACYAGPIFNTLVGLGLPLVFSSWAAYPSFYVIPRDPFVYETMGFLMVGLLWALVVLPKRNMRLDRFSGIGLLAIYLCFLCLKMARSLGLFQEHGFSSYFKH
ncbi:hypothetical protein F0562_022427 [Nyssa sinensis]|uniref:Sodium/calcium exchanger membrane region domain-containing protein n=1 Tax=Nyssa sinensis TaxID=561372 RepID=A0A5J5BMR4_9ASTE|nr:hypothetical protein F0562_022427 [Nyssa sinensis]